MNENIILCKMTKPRSPYYLQWIYEEKHDWLLLKKFKTKTNEEVEKSIICIQDQKDWISNLQNTQGWQITK